MTTTKLKVNKRCVKCKHNHKLIIVENGMFRGGPKPSELPQIQACYYRLNTVVKLHVTQFAQP